MGLHQGMGTIADDFADEQCQGDGECANNGSKAADAQLSPRVMGLHRGLVTMSDDFDEPLPDEFWLGQE